MSKTLFLGTTGEFEATKVDLIGDGEGIGDGTGSFQAVSPVDLYGNALGVGTGIGSFSPPATGDWPDPFMSYTPSGPIVLSGQSNVTIDYLSFDRTARRDLGQPRPISLNGCDNITIRRIDTRGCTMGLVYAVNSSNITVEYCRSENINEEYDHPGWSLPPSDPNYYHNMNDMNFFQFNACNVINVRDCKVRYGNTEDVMSLFASSNATIERVQIEGATLGNEPTSDGAVAQRWRSNSGTGAISGDGGGSTNNKYIDCTFLNVGQVGIAIAGGTYQYFENCVSYSERASNVSEFHEKAGDENQAAYIYNQYGPPAEYSFMRNCRTLFASTGYNFWTDGSLQPQDLTGSVFGDGSLNPEDYRVVL